MSLHRQRVVRADGRAFNVVQHRAHLTYCYTGCCCGITERGYAAVPVDVYTEEWLKRKIRGDVHLTKAGCIGPCALANVASLMFDVKSIWFHSVNSPWLVRQIFDYIDAMLKADRFLQPPAELVEYTFNYYDWDVRLPSPTEGFTRLGLVQPNGAIVLLSHADTDILTLIKASESLPPELRVSAYSLNALRNEDQMNTLIAKEILAQISEQVCEAGVRSLRADLAVVRASIAYAALIGDASVCPDHVSAVLPLALAHRRQDRGAQRVRDSKSPVPRSKEQQPEDRAQSDQTQADARKDAGNGAARVFAPQTVGTPALLPALDASTKRGASGTTQLSQPGPVVGFRRTETPTELDLRATLNSAVLETGRAHPRISDLHERIREPKAGTRYLLVIDSSGSHAVRERMRLVKGVAQGLLERSFKRGDEVGLIVLRGTSAQVLLEPTTVLQEATSALEYLPTGGRTPLAHALSLAQTYLTPSTVLVLLSDGRANVPLQAGDAWQDALDVAGAIKASALVIDTENSNERLGRSIALAEALGAGYIQLEGPDPTRNPFISLEDLAVTSQTRH